MQKSPDILSELADCRQTRRISNLFIVLLLRLISATGGRFPRAQRKPQPSLARGLLRLTYCAFPQESPAFRSNQLSKHTDREILCYNHQKGKKLKCIDSGKAHS